MIKDMPEQLRLNLQAISDLRWAAAVRFQGLLLCWSIAGYNRVRVLEATRSLERQQQLYGQGRSVQECKLAGVPAVYADPDAAHVTWCKPEESGHVQGRACDIDLDAYKGRGLGRAIAIAKALGFEWGGEWTVQDTRHFEIGG